MIIQLTQGNYNPGDTLDLITKMIHLKIKFYEDKIQKENNSAAIKKSELMIKQLQKDLFNARNKIEKHEGKISIQSQINLNN